MGTYDTKGGAPLSPDMEDPPCDACGGDPSDCGCPECPICGENGNPKCFVSEGRAQTYASALITEYKANPHDNGWMPEKAARIRMVAGIGCQFSMPSQDWLDRQIVSEPDGVDFEARS